MFNKENKPERFKDAETIIGSSIKVKGNFQGQGNIIIEGCLEGSLKTEANIYIGDKAKVTANIEAKEAIINGVLNGNVKSRSYLALGSTARITGDIQYGEISVERGAIINGQMLAFGENGKKQEAKKEEEKAE